MLYTRDFVGRSTDFFGASSTDCVKNLRMSRTGGSRKGISVCPPTNHRMPLPSTVIMFFNNASYVLQQITGPRESNSARWRKRLIQSGGRMRTSSASCSVSGAVLRPALMSASNSRDGECPGGCLHRRLRDRIGTHAGGRARTQAIAGRDVSEGVIDVTPGRRCRSEGETYRESDTGSAEECTAVRCFLRSAVCRQDEDRAPATACS
jgi:hypothetical protein